MSHMVLPFLAGTKELLAENGLLNQSKTILKGSEIRFRYVEATLRRVAEESLWYSPTRRVILLSELFSISLSSSLLTRA